MTDDALLLDDALRQLYRAHDLPADGGASSDWFHVKLGPLTIPLPNPPSRQRAVFVHDTNHVLTGYNAVFSEGEMSIASFEVGAGCGRVWVAWILNLPLMALGVLVDPRRILRDFVRGRRSRSLYTAGIEREALRAMRVGDLRRFARLDETPPRATGADLAALGAYVLATWLVLLAPALAVVASLAAS